MREKGYPQLFNRFCGNEKVEYLNELRGLRLLITRVQLRAILQPKDELEP
jgi:hypothetical protein